MSHSSSILSRPICSNSSAWRASASAEAALCRVGEERLGPGEQLLLPAVDQGRVDAELAGQLVDGRSPLRAARATWALNAAVWIFRLPAIASPFLGHQSSLAGGPVFGVHYNRKFVETGGQVEVQSDRIVVRFDKRSHNPILREAELDKGCPPIPWLGDRRVSFAYP